MNPVRNPERLNWRGCRRARLCRLVLSVLLVAWAWVCLGADVQAMPAAAQAHRAALTRAAHLSWGLDAPIAALAAQVHQESSWKPEALSRSGAVGLAQFMPATARWWCELNKLEPLDCQPRNPSWALRAMVGYDKWLFDRTPAAYSRRDRMWVALRAYNGGLGHWQAEARKAAGSSREAVDAACGLAKRHPLHCVENLGYPARILGPLQRIYAGWGAQA